MPRNPEGIIIQIAVDLIGQLGLIVEPMTNLDGVVYGVQLVNTQEAHGVVQWINQAGPHIHADAEAWCGMVEFGLQRPKAPDRDQVLDQALEVWATARRQLDECQEEFEEEQDDVCAEYAAAEQVASETLRVARLKAAD